MTGTGGEQPADDPNAAVIKTKRDTIYGNQSFLNGCTNGYFNAMTAAEDAFDDYNESDFYTAYLNFTSAAAAYNSTVSQLIALWGDILALDDSYLEEAQGWIDAQLSTVQAMIDRAEGLRDLFAPENPWYFDLNWHVGNLYDLKEWLEDRSDYFDDEYLPPPPIEEEDPVTGNPI